MDNNEPQTTTVPSAQPLTLSVVESQERANIDMLIATAKKYPRDLMSVKRNMEAMATLDQETAEACNYRLIREGHSIEGPGVRMAEIAVASYQNIRAGSRVLSNDGKVITGQAFCHDLENNTFIAWETQRRITNKKGQTYSEDMQVMTGNAAAAIAFRNAVFKVIPGALVRTVADKARQVAVGDLKTLSERRTRALKRFASIGVREDQILAFLGKSSVEQIDIADVEKLFGVFTAIKDQSTTIEEQFPVVSKVVEPKVVEPNFDKPTAGESSPSQVAAPGTVGELPKRRGRPRKEETTQDAPKPEAQKPTAQEAPTQQEMVIQPSEQAKAPETELAPKSGPLSEVHKRLAEQKISHERFLLAMHTFAMIDADPADISAGNVPLSKVEEKYLKAALADWQTVLNNLPEV